VNVAAPQEKPARHQWHTRGHGDVTLYTLKRARLVGDVDEAVEAGSAHAHIGECSACGMVAAYVPRTTEGVDTSFTAYGVDHGSLCIMHHAPRCEPLPSRPSADDGRATP
jgi:hypothetical protein